MKLSFFFLLLLLGFPQTASAQTQIKSAEISFVFVSKGVEGSISGFNSSSSLDLNALSASQFKGSVDVETLKTGNFLRDWSLKSRKYFDGDEYPKIHFISTSVFETDTGFEVQGTLTLKGKQNPISFSFVREGNRLLGTTTLFSSDYGINIKKKREDNRVDVQLELQLAIIP
ncbi:MAG: YceI family protein [Bacteroidota bacterium]